MTKEHPASDNFFYPFIAVFSFIVRYILCYLTIEQIPIFESESAQWAWSALFGGGLYTIFYFICYFEVGLISKKFGINSSSAKSALYFVLYLPLIGIVFLALWLLTRFGVLPISIEITFNLKELIFNFAVWCAEMFQDLMLFLWNKVVDIINEVSKMCMFILSRINNF